MEPQDKLTYLELRSRLTQDKLIYWELRSKLTEDELSYLEFRFRLREALRGRALRVSSDYETDVFVRGRLLITTSPDLPPQVEVMRLRSLDAMAVWFAPHLEFVESDGRSWDDGTTMEKFTTVDAAVEALDRLEVA